VSFIPKKGHKDEPRGDERKQAGSSPEKKRPRTEKKEILGERLLKLRSLFFRVQELASYLTCSEGERSGSALKRRNLVSKSLGKGKPLDVSGSVKAGGNAIVESLQIKGGDDPRERRKKRETGFLNRGERTGGKL